MAAEARALRASQEAVIRGVMPLGKSWAIPCLRLTASRLAEHYRIGVGVHEVGKLIVEGFISCPSRLDYRFPGDTNQG